MLVRACKDSMHAHYLKYRSSLPEPAPDRKWLPQKAAHDYISSDCPLAANRSSSNCNLRFLLTDDRMVFQLHLQGRAYQVLLPRRRRATEMVRHSRQSSPAVRSCIPCSQPRSPPRATPPSRNLQRSTRAVRSVPQAGTMKDRGGLGRLSTAQDVLDGKDLSGTTFFVSGGNSGIGCAAMHAPHGRPRSTRVPSAPLHAGLAPCLLRSHA